MTGVSNTSIYNEAGLSAHSYLVSMQSSMRYCLSLSLPPMFDECMSFLNMAVLDQCLTGLLAIQCKDLDSIGQLAPCHKQMLFL